MHRSFSEPFVTAELAADFVEVVRANISQFSVDPLVIMLFSSLRRPGFPPVFSPLCVGED